MSEIIIQNSMVGKFGIIHLGMSEIPCTFRPVYVNSSEIKCSVKVPPHNRMVGRFDVKPRPKITEVLSPVKDAFVREFVPTFNYGSSSELYVGRDKNGERYRSFLFFSLDGLRKDLTFTKAKLTLYINNTAEEFDGLELSTADRDWEEHGITWAGQPSRSRLLKVTAINNYETKIEFDVLDIIEKWYSGQFKNYGFLLKALDETVEQLKSFGSRESTRNKPTLEIQYYDPDFRIYKKNEVKANLTVKARRESDLKAQLTVHSNWNHKDMKVKFHVHNMDMLECFFNVTKPILPSYLHIRQKNDLKATFTPKFSNINEIKVSFYPTFKNLLSKLIVKRTDTDDLPSEVIVKKKDGESLRSEGFIVVPHIFGNVNVKKHNDLPSEVTIRKPEYSEVECKATIIQKNIYSTVKVKAVGDLKSYITVKQYKTHDLTANVNITQDTIIGKLDVVKTNDLPAEVTVIRRDDSDLDCFIIVKRHGESELPATITTKAVSDMPCSIFILSPYMRARLTVKQIKHKNLIAYGHVKQVSDIKSKVNIKRYANIKGRLKVKIRWFSDVKCYINIIGGTAVKRAYAFIM